DPFGFPGRHPKFVRTASGAIPKQSPWETAFKTSAAPDRYRTDCRVLQRTVNPRSTGPVRRSNIPIRMVVEGNNCKCLADAPHKNCREMVKISGSREHESPKSPAE